jgi:hypothetical protein
MLALGGASVIVVVAGSLATTANAAYIRSATSSEGKDLVFLDGEIEPGDAQSLRNVIKRSNDANRLVSAIRLNSPGGNLGEGARLADMIRYGHIPTVVPAGAQCASACFLVFAAGPEKYASYSANVGDTARTIFYVVAVLMAIFGVVLLVFPQTPNFPFSA